MTSVKQATQYTAVAGIIATVFFFIVAILIVDEPEFDASAQDVFEYISKKGGSMLAAVYFEGLCICFTIAFLVGFGLLCGRAECCGDDAPHVPFFSAIGAAGGVAIFTAAAVGFGAIAEIAIHRPTPLANAEIARASLSFTQITVNMTGFLTAISNAGYCMVMSGVFAPTAGRILTICGWILVVLHLISGGAFATSGLLAPSGLGVFVCAPLYYVWVLAISICLLLDKCLNNASPTSYPQAQTALTGGSSA